MRASTGRASNRFSDLHYTPRVTAEILPLSTFGKGITFVAELRNHVPLSTNLGQQPKHKIKVRKIQQGEHQVVAKLRNHVPPSSISGQPLEHEIEMCMRTNSMLSLLKLTYFNLVLATEILPLSTFGKGITFVAELRNHVPSSSISRHSPEHEIEIRELQQGEHRASSQTCTARPGLPQRSFPSLRSSKV
eukprot:Gb_07916 [translate_table: standard]